MANADKPVFAQRAPKLRAGAVEISEQFLRAHLATPQYPVIKLRPTTRVLMVAQVRAEGVYAGGTLCVRAQLTPKNVLGKDPGNLRPTDTN
jgi:hypothetical protein